MRDATTPVRLRLSRARGFDLQLLSRSMNGLPAKSVTRPGRFGNPYTVEAARECGYRGTDDELRRFCAATFRNALRHRLPAVHHMLNRLKDLRGHNLACWCPLPAPGAPDHCHAAVLLDVIPWSAPA